jgi:hypothetical protein
MREMAAVQKIDLNLIRMSGPQTLAFHQDILYVVGTQSTIPMPGYSKKMD